MGPSSYVKNLVKLFYNYFVSFVFFFFFFLLLLTSGFLYYNNADASNSGTLGEKEWYFFCKRGRKYKNSVRPNRVTGCGFWKATGIDKPIYSNDRCVLVGLKKTLVYYRGSAGRGTKTEWMMNEFRLPSSSSSSPYSSDPFRRNIIKNNLHEAVSNKFYIPKIYPFLLGRENDLEKRACSEYYTH